MDDDILHELFAAVGPVQIRRMFGGKGIYCDGAIVAIAFRDGQLLLKVDETTAPSFEEAGATQWRYQREGKAPVAMPYFTLPESAYDDPDEMALWARRARDAGLRAAMSVRSKAAPKRRKSSVRSNS